MWHRFLVWLGARAPTTMTTAQAVAAVRAGQMSAAQGAAACGLSARAFGTQLRAGIYLARGGFALMSGPLAAAILAVGMAASVGYAMYATKDQPDTPPAQPGWNMRYYVVVAEGGRAIYSIRTAGAVKKGIAWKRFRHGGISSEPAKLRTVSGPHFSRDDATRDLARRIRRGTLRKPPLAAGKVAVVGGKGVTIDDWGHVNMALLTKLVG